MTVDANYKEISFVNVLKTPDGDYKDSWILEMNMTAFASMGIRFLQSSILGG